MQSTPLAPVAATSSVSEVDVSLSTVIALKVRSQVAVTQRLQRGVSDLRIGKT